MENEIQINKINFFDLFINNKFLKIPIFQRNFVWKKEEVAEFILSIIEEFQEKENLKQKIYLGNILTANDEKDQKNLFIIDGQQRITMFLILLEEIKNKLNKIKLKENSDSIFYKELISNINTLILENNKRKLLFDNNIHNKKWNEDKEDKIIDARQIVKKIIDENLLKEQNEENDYDNFHKLRSFFNFCKEKIIIGHVKIEDIKDSVDIFEKMNGNKVELTDWDLIKALYIKKCQDDNKKYKEAIVSLNNNFINNFKEVNITISETDFSEIITFFITKKIVKKQKYTKILETIRKQKLSIIDLLNEFYKKSFTLLNLIQNDIELSFYFYLAKIFKLKSINKYFITILLSEIESVDKIAYLKIKMFQITIFYLIHVSLYKKGSKTLENVLKNISSNWLNNNYSKGEIEFNSLLKMHKEIIKNIKGTEGLSFEIVTNKKSNILFAYLLSDLSNEWFIKIVNQDLKVEEILKIGDFIDDNPKISNLIVLNDKVNKSKSLTNLTFINELKRKLTNFINEINDEEYKNNFIEKDYRYILKIISDKNKYELHKKARIEFLQNHILKTIEKLDTYFNI